MSTHTESKTIFHPTFVRRTYADPQLRDAYARFMRHFPWKLFCVFEDPRSGADGQALCHRIAQLFSFLQKYYSAPAGAWVVLERRHQSAYTAAIPCHAHVLITSSASVQPRIVSRYWRDIVSPNPAHCHIQPYSPALGGVEYMLKLLNHPNHDWYEHHLELFSHDLPAQWRRDAQSRRRHRRQLQRLLM